MAKKKKKQAAEDTTVGNRDQAAATAPAAEEAAPTEGGKPASVAGYFRQLFKENPKLPKETSNQKLLDRWQADHPGQEVTKSIRNNLANLKSVLRSKKRGRVADKTQGPRDAAHEGRSIAATVPTGGSPLEALEHQIDECLSLARSGDPEGLRDVIQLLRRARNAVVWKIGS